MKSKLDKKTVATLALPAGKSDEIFWDDALARFGLRLRRSGDRLMCTWMIQYRCARGARKMTIGPAETLSPEQVREAARQKLAQVDLGGDPQADRSERRDILATWEDRDRSLVAGGARKILSFAPPQSLLMPQPACYSYW
jgi:hypothetical protein